MVQTSLDASLNGDEASVKPSKEDQEALKIAIASDDFTAEEVKALYFDKDALVEPPYKLFRLTAKTGVRYYYFFDKNNTPQFFISVTTFIHKALPMAPQLVKWIADMGWDKAEEYKKERGLYGTFMHQAIEQLTINLKYDLDSLEENLKEYIEKHRLMSTIFESWYYEMKKDILSWAQFVIDHDVKPIGIELMLCSQKDGFAGAIDLVCEMNIMEKGEWGEVYASGEKKGQPKITNKSIRIKAIIDNKGSKKGFFEANELQLHCYRRMFQENYPQHKIDRVFNWAGKDWRTEPGYHLKDQTHNPVQHKITNILSNAMIDAKYKDEQDLLIISGKIDITRGITRNYRTITKEELVIAKK